MKSLLLIPLTFLITLATTPNNATAQDFYLHENGVTVMCSDADILLYQPSNKKVNRYHVYR